MLRVGLTGGIASGKSTVSAILSREGIPVIDADSIARDVVVPGSEALSEVVEEFGPTILVPDGSLDRIRLGEIVFSDPSRRRVLEGILHPRILAEQDRRLDELEAAGGTPVAVVDAALMIESGAWRRFDVLVVVDCDEVQQIERLRRRNGLSEAAARDRVRTQIPLLRKVGYADRIINNRQGIDATEHQVLELVAWLRKRAAWGDAKKD